MRRLRGPFVERALWAAGLLLIAVYLGVRGYGELMRRSELRRFDEARKAASVDRAPRRDLAPVPKSAPAPSSSAGPALRVPAAVDTRLWSPQRIRGYEESFREEAGHPLAVLRIPRIGIEVPVLDGTDEVTLNRGVGRIEGTALPGQAGNLGIAGHRDGFFRGLKDVALGDAVELETLEGAEAYVVDDIRIVNPDDVSVLEPTSAPAITMVTCYPFYFVGSAPRRYIVRARRSGAPPSAGSRVTSY